MAGRNRKRMKKWWERLIADLADRARRKRTGDNSRKRTMRPKRWREAEKEAFYDLCTREEYEP